MQEIICRDPLDNLNEACYEYRLASLGMLNPNETREKHYIEAKEAYKKALKNATKYLRNELKSLEMEDYQ